MSSYFKKNLHNTIVEILLTKFLPYRGLTLIDNANIDNSIIEEMQGVEASQAAQTSQTEALSKSKKIGDFNDMIVNNIKNAGFIQIDAMRTVPRGERNLVVFLILSDDDEKKKKNKNIKKIIDNYALDKDNNLDEFIIITEKSEFLKSAFIKLMTELKMNEIGKDFKGEKAIYNAYPYHNFLVDIPNHVSVPRHRIMEDREIQDNLFSEYIKANDIYTIYEFDPPIVWLGGRDGQIVEVIRLSSSSLEAPVYRLIKAELYKPER